MARCSSRTRRSPRWAPASELRAAYPDEPTLDAGGRVVMPGFVDPHTHAIWAGDRAAEFEMRLQGKTYLEILAAGGGILSTVRATRTGLAGKAAERDPPAPVEHVHLRHHHRRGQDRLWLAHRRRAAHAAGAAGAGRRRPAGDRPHLPGRARHRPGIQRPTRTITPT